jgi:hypothetical protein
MTPLPARHHAAAAPSLTTCGHQSPGDTSGNDRTPALLPEPASRPVAGPARVNAGGTRLRIRALHVMGHSAARISRAAGTDEQVIQRLARGTISSVSRELSDAIAQVYDAWWDKRPPERTPGERTAAAAARRRAARGNWCAAAGLDDDLIDLPGYRPAAPWRPAAGTGIAPDIQIPGRRKERTRMSCDARHTRALVTDVLAVLHQHGYRPGDPAHTRRAERLIGDLACIYQGSQDAPTGAYIIVGPPPTIAPGHAHSDMDAAPPPQQRLGD